MLTSNYYIEQALSNYQEPINTKREDPYDLSSYLVTKPWGSEGWLDLNQNYAFKLISMNAGYQSSLQKHTFKFEANYVIEGECEVYFENVDGEKYTKRYQAGSGWIVPAGVIHRVTAISNYRALEVSSPHLDDVIRLEDNHSRPSGRISEEHTING